MPTQPPSTEEFTAPKKAQEGRIVACYAPLNQYRNIEDGRLVFRAPKNRPEGTWTKTMTVQCGQCLGCRIDRSAAWAARIVHEAQDHKDNCFVTLTYDKLPENGSLNKEDIQKFFKRLRRKNPSVNLKYFQCGEYGDQLQRPHHHACIFNFDFPDKQPFSEREGIVTYTSEELNERWGHGFTTLGELNYETAAYTARYCVKKVTGVLGRDHYMRWDDDGVAYWLRPEFITMSKGIGRKWYDQYKKDLFPSDEMPVPGKGVYKKIARFYEKLLEKDDPTAYEELKQRRMDYYNTHQDEYTPEKLYAKYKVKKAQTDKLKRTI